MKRFYLNSYSLTPDVSCRKAYGFGFCSLWIVCAFLGVLFFISPIALSQEASLFEEPQGTIRSIRIEIKEIFDDPEMGGFYRGLNGIKISTKEEVVRRELLLKEGEPFDRFLLEESERNLRSLPFLRQVSILPVVDGEWVDLIVSVQDTWTIFPQLSFSTGTGTNKKSIGLAETNVMGYGKRAEVLYGDDDGRQKIEGVWDDRRLFGTYQRLLVGHFERSDGFRNVFFYGKPFRTLVQKESWAVNTDFSDLVGRLFENSEERYIFRQRHNEAATRYTIARGDPDKLLHRFGLGYEYIEDTFLDADEGDFEDVDVDPDSVSQDPALLPEDREFSGPVLSYDRIESEFISINYADRFERVEDFVLGNVLSAKATIAGKTFGSIEDTLLLSVSDSQGWRFSPTSFIRGEIGLGTRLNNDGVENTLLRGELKYYNVLGAKYLWGTYIGKHTLASNLMLDYGDDLDKDRELLLGAGGGLRGYKDKTFTGDKRFVMNVEDRFHIVEDIYKLVSLGGAFFVDIGGTTNDELGEVFTDELYSDIGFGFRFGFPRSSGGSIARFDIAFPLRDGPDGSSQFEPRFIFTTGQMFYARLRSESLGPEKANVTVGLDR